MAKVFINPGHDLNLDSGAVNPNSGLRECDVCADIGDRVVKYLIAAGCEVKSMQDDSLTAVVDASDDWDADLFVSIHCNACNTEAQGTETFSYYNSASGGRLAECIQRQIVDALPVVDRGVKTEGFYVIRWTNCPAVLVETAFIDNDEDAELLVNQKDEFAKAIARGITDYLSGV